MLLAELCPSLLPVLPICVDELGERKVNQRLLLLEADLESLVFLEGDSGKETEALLGELLFCLPAFISCSRVGGGRGGQSSCVSSTIGVISVELRLIGELPLLKTVSGAEAGA